VIVHRKKGRLVFAGRLSFGWPDIRIQSGLIVADSVAQHLSVGARQRIELSIFAAAGTGFQRDRCQAEHSADQLLLKADILNPVKRDRAVVAVEQSTLDPYFLARDLIGEARPDQCGDPEHQRDQRRRGKPRMDEIPVKQAEMEDDDGKEILSQRAHGPQDDAQRVQALERGALVRWRAGGQVVHIMSWRI